MILDLHKKSSNTNELLANPGPKTSWVASTSAALLAD